MGTGSRGQALDPGLGQRSCPHDPCTPYPVSDSDNAYCYEQNGNMTKDLDCIILSIQYNLLNLPRKITYTDGSMATYTYNSLGEKLQVAYATSSLTASLPAAHVAESEALALGQTLYAGSTDYLLGGSLVVKDGLTDRYLFDGGYAKASAVNPTAYSFEFHYYNSDHLGNIREVVDSAGVVEQVTNYYPFGTPYTQSAAVMNANMQPYKYNGNELDRMHGLDTYDYGARQYNPVTARWDRMDPLCEKYYDISPYAYCGNNPVMLVDLDGRVYGDYYTKEGAYAGSDGIKDEKAYVSNSEGDVSFNDLKFSELSVSNSILNQFANTVAQESSGNKLESYAIASAIINISNYKGKTVIETLKSEGIYGYKDGGYSTKYNDNKKYGMEAALNALTDGVDYSNGALRWDGFDLAAKGFNHVKARTAGISISSDHFNSFKAAWPNNKIKAFSGGKYNEFSVNFSAGNHPATEGRYIGLTLYQSSAVYGRTIFWTPIKDDKFNGKY